MYEMSLAQWREFAGHGTRTGKLATVRANGTPHVAPVWFLLETADGHDEIVFTTGAGSVKGRNLRREPRLSLCVDEEVAPYSYVLFEAEARLSEDPGELLRYATRIAARYMGEDQAQAYGKRNGVPGELLVRARITKVIAHADVAD